MDYSDRVLFELERLENFCDRYKAELLFLSKRIRRDVWKDGNGYVLAGILKSLNDSLEETYPDKADCTIDTVLDYAHTLGKYNIFINPKLDAGYYEKLIDDILLENAKVIIDEKWKNINTSSDGSRTFLETFGEIFTQSIELRKEEFFRPLRKSDILCRVVDGWGHDIDRFIPWPNKAQNRWNPPGRTYLYLSFAESLQAYNADFSISEYVCLEEFRAKKGEKHSFCLFEMAKEGNILDLSYNDIDLGAFRRKLDNYKHGLEKVIFSEIISDPKKVERYRRNGKELEKAIDRKSVV